MKPDIKIKLDGKDYRLRLNVRSIINIEDELGYPMLRLSSEQIGIKQVCIFIKHAIRDADGKKITTDQWDELTEEIGAEDIMGAFGALMAEKKKKEKEAKPGKNLK